MEIERKFLIDAFPEGYQELERAEVEQGYLCTEPVVRIRKKSTASGATTYVLCIKGNGDIARTEVETFLSSQQYSELKAMLDRRMITKEYRKYALPGGLVLECSLVDRGYPDEFMYAEVEFETVEQANEYVPEPCLGKELTYMPDFTMASIWQSIPVGGSRRK